MVGTRVMLALDEYNSKELFSSDEWNMFRGGAARKDNFAPVTHNSPQSKLQEISVKIRQDKDDMGDVNIDS